RHEHGADGPGAEQPQAHGDGPGPDAQRTDRSVARPVLGGHGDGGAREVLAATGIGPRHRLGANAAVGPAPPARGAGGGRKASPPAGRSWCERWWVVID